MIQSNLGINIAQNESERLFQEVYKLGLNRDPKISMALRFQQIDPDDTVLGEIIAERIKEEQLIAITDPNPFRTTTPIEAIPGTILLGRVPETGLLWLIHPDQLTNHILVTGRSGGGKTNLVLLILAQLLERSNYDQGI